MSFDLSRQDRPAGMSLIELLVAVSVSTLIVGVALSVYLTLSASLRRQTDKRLDLAVTALDSLRHDLVSCSQGSFSNTPLFDVRTTASDNGSPPLSTLSVCGGSLPQNVDDLSRMEVKRIRYTLQPDGNTGDQQTLMRESFTLWGAESLAPPVSNALLKGVSRFEVRVLDGSEWTNRWTSRPNRPFPRAAQVRLDWESARTTETASIVVFIPAGNSVSAQTNASR